MANSVTAVANLFVNSVFRNQKVSSTDLIQFYKVAIEGASTWYSVGLILGGRVSKSFKYQLGWWSLISGIFFKLITERSTPAANTSNEGRKTYSVQTYRMFVWSYAAYKIIIEGGLGHYNAGKKIGLIVEKIILLNDPQAKSIAKSFAVSALFFGICLQTYKVLSSDIFKTYLTLKKEEQALIVKLEEDERLQKEQNAEAHRIADSGAQREQTEYHKKCRDYERGLQFQVFQRELNAKYQIAGPTAEL